MALQLFQSAANCSFPLLFLQSAFSSTWPANRLQIERKPATSYALAMPNRTAKPALAPPYRPGPCPLAISGRVGGIVPCPWLRPVSASFVVRGQPPFCRCASVLRFTFFFFILLFSYFFLPLFFTGPGAGLHSCAQFFLCCAVWFALISSLAFGVSVL